MEENAPPALNVNNAGRNAPAGVSAAPFVVFHLCGHVDRALMVPMGLIYRDITHLSLNCCFISF